MSWNDVLVFFIIWAGMMIWDSPNIFCIWRLKRSAKTNYYKSLKILKEQKEKSIKSGIDAGRKNAAKTTDFINEVQKNKEDVDQLFGYYEKDTSNSYSLAKHWIAYTTNLREYVNDMEYSTYVEPNYDKIPDWWALMECYEKIFKTRLETAQQSRLNGE